MGYVYLLHNWDSECDLYKIGVSKHEDIIKKRINGLQTGNPHEILLVNKYECENYYRVETMLHNYYFGNHKRGEWFTLEFEQVKEFTDKCKYFDDMIILLKKENPFYK
jgi:hypothetical protein